MSGKRLDLQLTVAQRQLARENVALAFFYARGQFCQLTHSERVSACYVGLLRAVRTWKPERGEFSGHVRRWCRRMLYDDQIVFHNRNQKQLPLYFDGLVAPENDHELTYEAALTVIRTLDSRARKVLLDTFLEGRTLVQCARDLGVSPQYAHQVRTAALKRIREVMQCCQPTKTV